MSDAPRDTGPRLDIIESILVQWGLADFRKGQTVPWNEAISIPDFMAKVEERFKPGSAPNPVNKAPDGVQFYVSVPVQIRAIQWTGDNDVEVSQFTIQTPPEQRDGKGMGFSISQVYGHPVASLWVNANKDWLAIETGEWVAMDMHGCYPIKDDVFRMKYREVE